MSALREDSWILLSASTFILLQNIVLVEVFEESLDSHRYVIGKGKSILAACSDNVDILL